MMKNKSRRRTETTIETREVWVVRSPMPRSPVWCPECAGRSLMLAPEEAARMINANPRTVYRWVEGGQAHFRESENGWLLVCLASLSATDAVAAPSLQPVAPTASD